MVNNLVAIFYLDFFGGRGVDFSGRGLLEWVGKLLVLRFWAELDFNKNQKCGLVTEVTMVNVFVDESGNLGKAGEFFVLGAVVFSDMENQKRAKRIIRKEQKIIAAGKTDGKILELKSNQMGFKQQRRILCKLYEKIEYDLFYFVAHKPSVSLLNEKRPKNLVYNYFAGLFMDKIFAKYNDDFYVTFDLRTTGVESLKSLPDYIKLRAYLNNNIHGRVEISQLDSKTCACLQFADLVSGAVYKAYTRGEKKYLDLLKDRIVLGSKFPYKNFPKCL